MQYKALITNLCLDCNYEHFWIEVFVSAIIKKKKKKKKKFTSIFNIFRVPATLKKIRISENAFCPLKWKSGLILRLFNRAKGICSDNTLFRKEIEKVRAIFKAIGYSSRSFDRLVQQFYS